jgi:biopolymer transport protein ExbD
MERAFRQRGALALHEMHFGPNMTPMVDVVMVILIFFMASTALLGPEWFVQANLPETDRGAGAGDNERFTLPEVRIELSLRVGELNTTFVHGFGPQPLTLGDFEAQVGATAADLRSGGPSAEPIVVIRPEPGVPYQDVVRVHDACTAAGFTRVGLG